MSLKAFFFLFSMLILCFISAWLVRGKKIGKIIRDGKESELFSYLYDGNSYFKMMFSNLGSVLSLSLIISICVGCYYLIGVIFLAIPIVVFGLSYFLTVRVQRRLLLKQASFSKENILIDLFNAKQKSSKMVLFVLVVFQYTLYISAEIFVFSKILPIFWGNDSILTTIALLTFCFLCYLYVLNYGYSGVINTDLIQISLALFCLAIITFFEGGNVVLCFKNFYSNLHLGNAEWGNKFLTSISLIIIGVSYFVAFPDNFIRNIFTLSRQDGGCSSKHRTFIGITMGLLALLSLVLLVFSMGVMESKYGKGFDVQHGVDNFPVLVKEWISHFSNQGLTYSVLCVVCLFAMTSIDTWLIGSMQTIDSILHDISGFRYFVLLPFIIVMAFYLGVKMNGQYLLVLGIFTYPVLFMEAILIFRLFMSSVNVDLLIWVTFINEFVMLILFLLTKNIHDFVFISLLVSFIFEVSCVFVGTVGAKWVSREHKA